MSLMQTIKTAATIQPGDIFRSEYGDFDNWCEFVFISCEPDKDFKNCTKIDVRYVSNNTIFSIYDLHPIDKVKFDVIGHTEVLINENTDNSK